jgi:diacylglycerol kinase family enzyme
VRAALIVNPGASRVTPELTAAVEQELLVSGPVETILTERPGHAVELVADAGASFERIYVYSGDGGYNEAVNGLDGPIPLAFVPGGATSVLPRALGLPRDPVECARTLAHSPRTRTISLGRINGRRFTFAAGVGLDAEVVRGVDALGRRRGRRAGDLAYLRVLAERLTAAHGRLEPAMTVLGRGRAAFAIVVNGDPYSFAGPFPVHVMPDARFELGLDLIAAERISPGNIPPLVRSVLSSGAHVRWRNMIALHDADEIRIECDRPTPLHADGEDLGDARDVLFECERAALEVVVG